MLFDTGSDALDTSTKHALLHSGAPSWHRSWFRGETPLRIQSRCGTSCHTYRVLILSPLRITASLLIADYKQLDAKPSFAQGEVPAGYGGGGMSMHTILVCAPDALAEAARYRCVPARFSQLRLADEEDFPSITRRNMSLSVRWRFSAVSRWMVLMA